MYLEMKTCDSESLSSRIKSSRACFKKIPIGGHYCCDIFICGNISSREA
jgi:hypothetical protein